MSESAPVRVLVLGYGNPGRCDDGLGPALVESLAAEALPGVTIDADYQLAVEDAAVIAEHDVVIFVDAAVKGTEPFYFRPVIPSPVVSFSTHSLSPESLLGLARDVFQKERPGYVLGIRGYEFNEFGERLSPRAAANLERARDFIGRVLRQGNWAAAVTGSDE
ncbi:MAG: hydrogenase maturation protease [Acidobacteria bacterium]|nr:hydrogenase maturation protease [Acidobacteriota bacterium]